MEITFGTIINRLKEASPSYEEYLNWLGESDKEENRMSYFDMEFCIDIKYANLEVDVWGLKTIKPRNISSLFIYDNYTMYKDYIIFGSLDDGQECCVNKITQEVFIIDEENNDIILYKCALNIKYFLNFWAELFLISNRYLYKGIVIDNYEIERKSRLLGGKEYFEFANDYLYRYTQIW